MVISQTRNRSQPLPPQILQGVDVLVIGDSLGGRAAAVALAKYGAKIRIRDEYVRTPHTSSSGLMLRDNGWDAVGDFGLQLESGIWVTERTQIQNGIPNRHLPPGRESLVYSGLYRALCNRSDELGITDVKGGKKLVGVKESWSQPSVQYEDSEVETAQVVIGADGTDSTVRRLLAPPDQIPIYAGYVAWRGAVANRFLTGKQLDEFEKTLYEDLADFPRGGFFAFPIHDHLDGEDKITWNLCLPTPYDELLEVLPGYDGRSFLKPSQISQEAIARFTTHAQKHFPGFIADVVSHPENTYFGTVVKDLPDGDMPNFAYAPGIVAVGNAVYTPRPFGAWATTRAFENALKLRDVLLSFATGEDTLEEAFQDYGRTVLVGAMTTANRTRARDYQVGLSEGRDSPFRATAPIQDRGVV